MSGLLHVSTNPHIVQKDSTRSIMRDVSLALLPAALWGVYSFGIYAGWILLLSILSCVATEYIWEKAMKKENTLGDFSAVVTGLLLGMNLPATVPFWLPILGGVFAMLVVKQLFGGIGQNFMNPAMAARCFLLISFAGLMTDFPVVDGVSSATPLALLSAGEKVSISSLFFGTTSGVIGETSACLLLLGGVYLLCRRVITWEIPVIYLGSFAVFTVLFGGHGLDLSFVIAQLFAGGIMLGAIFMATDYVTSPITFSGRVIYAILLGVLTGLIRFFSNSAEGTSYAIIFCNLLVPLIEKVTLPKAFGREGRKK